MANNLPKDSSIYSNSRIAIFYSGASVKENLGEEYSNPRFAHYLQTKHLNNFDFIALEVDLNSQLAPANQLFSTCIIRPYIHEVLNLKFSRHASISATAPSERSDDRGAAPPAAGLSYVRQYIQRLDGVRKWFLSADQRRRQHQHIGAGHGSSMCSTPHLRCFCAPLC